MFQIVPFQQPNTHLCTPLVMDLQLLFMGVHRYMYKDKTRLENSRFHQTTSFYML